MTRAPESLRTARLVLRRPAHADAQGIFDRYASDPEVTRYMAWPTHRSIEDTLQFLNFSDSEWTRHPAGPYLIELDSSLIGSTGMEFTAPDSAETGYILARDAWGFGYATEALGAMVGLARELGLRRLTASVHVENRKSMRVLEKCGVVCTGSDPGRYPNVSAGTAESSRYVWTP